MALLTEVLACHSSCDSTGTIVSIAVLIGACLVGCVFTRDPQARGR